MVVKLGISYPKWCRLVLYFAGLWDSNPADRVLDLKVQGTTAVETLDVVGKTGAKQKAFVQALRNVEATDTLTLKLVREGRACL